MPTPDMRPTRLGKHCLRTLWQPIYSLCLQFSVYFHEKRRSGGDNNNNSRHQQKSAMQNSAEFLIAHEWTSKHKSTCATHVTACRACSCSCSQQHQIKSLTFLIGWILCGYWWLYTKLCNVAFCWFRFSTFRVCHQLIGALGWTSCRSQTILMTPMHRPTHPTNLCWIRRVQQWIIWTVFNFQIFNCNVAFFHSLFLCKDRCGNS